MEKQCERIEDFLQLEEASPARDKLALLADQREVYGFLNRMPKWQEAVSTCSTEEKISLYSTLLLGMGPHLFGHFLGTQEDKVRLHALGSSLAEVERFYRAMGGILGYQKKVLELIVEKKRKRPRGLAPSSRYLPPCGLNLKQDPKRAEVAWMEGIKQLGLMAEIYPVGGAGDRLDLIAESGAHLPAALLSFQGRTLLEGLIRDLEAREYLHHKLFGKKLLTPIVLMTSYEKDNYTYLHRLCERNSWFDRGEDNFFFMVQPLVPVVTEEGLWRLKGFMEVVFKPGGHGVVWRLAQESRAFEWMLAKGRKKALVRQINNPLAGEDIGLLAFCGEGILEDKSFGFLSCERLVGSAEGVLVLTKNEDLHSITNLEYTDFTKFGIKDEAVAGTAYSLYPSNTNVLFLDIEKVQKVIDPFHIPGLLVNLKEEQIFDPFSEHFRPLACGRLESTMQNIADSFQSVLPSDISNEELQKKLDTFVVYNERWKTISVTKRSYVTGKTALETPEGAFFDLLAAHRRLLQEYCHFRLPKEQSMESYLKEGPDILFLYHPALGPPYSLIAKKVRKGILHPRSELQLEIAEVDIENLEVEGSLLVIADEQTKGFASLKNVVVKNRGRSLTQGYPAWKNRFQRKESFTIMIHPGGEFIAEDLVFVGNHIVEVPANCLVTARMIDGKLSLDHERICTS